MTDGSEAEIERGNYRYAATVKQTMDDPVNDVEAGTITIVAGRCDDGVIRTVLDDETKDFLDIKGEVIERFHADTRMSKRDIKSWAATQANESEVDYSDV
jgi:hypothetical protein